MIILLTDGASSDSEKAKAASAELQGGPNAKVFCVGVGASVSTFGPELEKLCSFPPQRFLHIVADWGSLDRILQKLLIVEGDKEWISIKLAELVGHPITKDCKYVTITVHRWGHEGTLQSVRQAFCHIYEGFTYQDTHSAYERAVMDDEDDVELAHLTLSNQQLAQESVHVLVMFRVCHQWFAMQAAIPTHGRRASECHPSIQKFIREKVKPLEAKLESVKKLAMRVRVPEGVEPNSDFMCHLPMGGVVQVRVPHHARPGDWVTFKGPRPSSWTLAK